jgi:hypothetical protein
MLSILSRFTMIVLAAYSYFQIRPDLGDTSSGHPAVLAPKMLFAIQLLVTLLFFIIPYFPEAMHFGSRRLTDYSPRQLERIIPLLKDTLGLMGVLAASYFAINIHLFAGQAQSSNPREAARQIVGLEPWLVGGLLTGEAAVTFFYLRRFDSVGDSDGADQPTRSSYT